MSYLKTKVVIGCAIAVLGSWIGESNPSLRCLASLSGVKASVELKLRSTLMAAVKNL